MKTVFTLFTENPTKNYQVLMRRLQRHALNCVYISSKNNKNGVLIIFYSQILHNISFSSVCLIAAIKLKKLLLLSCCETDICIILYSKKFQNKKDTLLFCFYSNHCSLMRTILRSFPNLVNQAIFNTFVRLPP